MKRRVQSIWAVLTSLMIITSGCRPQQPFYLREDGDLSHYIDMATELEYPDVDTATLEEVTEALPPLTLKDMQFANYWDLSLEEAIQTALKNTKVMRSLGGRFVSSAFNNRAQTGEAPDAITLAPDQIRTVYDPAIVETTPFNGVENALSAFDAQWSTNFFYQHNDRQQNVRPNLLIDQFFLQVFEQNTSTFNTQITKITAQGGQFSVRNNIVYDMNNNPTRIVAKDWNVNYEMSFNQPLLAGAGTEFNRIAGPFNPLLQVVGGAPQSLAFDGVILARINVDISLAEFEGGVRNLVNDTEQAYWELAFAWRNLETANTALNSARQTWQKIKVLYDIGTKGGEAKEEAQAREQFYQFKSQAQTLLNELFRAEGRLRYIMGISPTDGRLIRPIDRPTVAKVDFDWREITEEALCRNLDLRRQKWRIKQRELELIAAKNLVLPRLDLNGTYRWLGLGDNLLGRNPTAFDPDTSTLQGTSAYQTLTTGQFQEWQAGAQMTMTIGMRKEFAQVRHYQMQLARARATLQDEELEISHQLTDAVRQLELNYELTQTNFNRTLAADRQVEAVQAAFEAETVTLDQLLEAQRRRAEAQTSFFRTLLDYQRAIIRVHYVKGSLLEYDNVYLAEGPWPDKAKFDAHRRARQRDAGVYLDYGYSRPDVISQGGVRQNVDGQPPLIDGPAYMEGQVYEGAEPVPAGQPVPSADTYRSGSLGEDAVGNVLGASLDQGFQWGPLGITGENKAPEDDTWARMVKDADSPGRPTRSALKQPQAAAAGGTIRDAQVQPAEHQSRRPLPAAHEPVANQPFGAVIRPATSSEGAQR